MERVTLIGRDHTWAPSMSDMQRERADAPLEKATMHVARWDKIGGLIAALLIGLMLGAML